MNSEAIIALVLKGITVAQAVWDNREAAAQALQSVKNILSNDKVTQDDLDREEAVLDALIDEFNMELPE